MSAAGRNPRLGGEHDFYPTPTWCVERLLEAWQPGGGVLVEPCVGNGAIVRCLPDWQWLTCDIKQHGEFLPDYICDFLRVLKVKNDLGVSDVITNPPYAIAEAIIRHSRLLYPQANIVMLLRIGFLCSQERRPFYAEMGQPDLYFLPDRPSFLGHGSDSSEYAWFVWTPEVRTAGKTMTLASTPRAVRCPKQPYVRKCKHCGQPVGSLHKTNCEIFGPGFIGGCAVVL